MKEKKRPQLFRAFWTYWDWRIAILWSFGSVLPADRGTFVLVLNAEDAPALTVEQLFILAIVRRSSMGRTRLVERIIGLGSCGQRW